MGDVIHLRCTADRMRAERSHEATLNAWLDQAEGYIRARRCLRTVKALLDSAKHNAPTEDIRQRAEHLFNTLTGTEHNTPGEAS